MSAHISMRSVRNASAFAAAASTIINRDLREYEVSLPNFVITGAQISNSGNEVHLEWIGCQPSLTERFGFIGQVLAEMEREAEVKFSVKHDDRIDITKLTF